MKIIKGKLNKAQKVVVYGPEGIGKSTFASKFPEPLFIDTEGSTAQLDVARTEAPSSWNMLMSQVDYVRNNPNICKTLVIDTADWAEKLTMQHICAKHQVDGIESIGYGKGYTYLEEEFGRFLNKLSDLIELGIHVVITAHSKISRFEQPDEIGSYDRWELKLQKKTSPLLKEWADMVLFANYKTLVVNIDNQGAVKGKNKAQGGKRVMYTQHTPSWDAKNRHGLSKELDFDYSNIAHLIGNLSNSTNKGPTIETKEQEHKAEELPKEPPAKLKYFRHKLIGNVFKEKDSDPKLPDGEVVEEITKEEYEKIAAQGNDIDNPMEQERTEIINIKENNPELSWEQAFEKYCSTPSKAEKELTEGAKELSRTEIKEVEDKFNNDNKVYIKNQSLRDLMGMHNVTVEEIQQVVADKGYYPAGTPINNYADDFVDGVLVGAWNQVLNMILEKRGK